MKKKVSLQNILNDKTSGSLEILFMLNEHVRQIADHQAKLKETINLAEKKLSHFSVIEDYLNRLKKISGKNSVSEIIDFTLSFQKETEYKKIKIYNNAQKFIKDKSVFLTISNSKTLADFFKMLKKDKNNLKVIIAESRPKNEGRNFAKVLLKNKINIEFITDSMISLYINKIDAVILGADILLKNGNIVNKVGSKTAAILAGYYKKPVYIIASRNKFSKRLHYKPPKENPDEIWNYKDDRLIISNYYFEEVEKKLITNIITD